MPDEKILRAKAREVVRAGKLPSRRPDRTWSGPGIDNSCTITAPGVERFHLHLRCFAAWEFERDRDGRPHS
jgi:hypothetical protein